MSLPAGWTPEQFTAASLNEIAAGRLPLSAQWRLAAQRRAAEQGGTAFTSGLSVGEFTALRSIGFSPVGQVMGSAVYHIGWTTGCGYRGWGGISGGGGIFGGGGPAPVVDVPGTRQLMEQARHRALHRLHQECAGLGADGVVAVRLTVGPFYGSGMEFVATGTAVRADGDVRPPHPFTSDLTGQDFVKLVRGGWMPVALVMGLGVALRHDDWRLLSQQSSWANQELAGLTQLVSAARSSARAGLDADVRRHGAAGVVLRDLVTNVVRVRCARSGSNSEAHDHFADVLAFGTAIVPLDQRRPEPTAPLDQRGAEPTAPPLPMLRLDPRQRRWIR